MKGSDQNKALCPNWDLCNFIVETATREDNCKLAFDGLEYMGTWIVKGERQRPPLFLSVDEDSGQEAEELFCPFTSLHPLVMACSKKGFETLDNDIGYSILEAYSRVLANLAFSILSRIGDILQEDSSSNPSPLAIDCSRGINFSHTWVVGSHLRQSLEPQLVDPTPLPPNPSPAASSTSKTGAPLSLSNSLAPVGLNNRASFNPLDPHVFFDFFDDCMA
ncbi:unnamed protein product [Sphenostylis stenocarpa]|uniref:PRONE domain-containing protein n=1 Tax=Sphenostylis stenocarpa TaxID=92480 RepID=A0AA86SIL1_9FABA|nr:unnamed protein product [Sphenostylis stenocarpa]